HRIDFSASTVVLFPSIMRIGVGENNVYTTRTDTFSRSRAYFPVFPPASYGLHGVLILISVVIAGIISFIQGAFPLLMERIGMFIPVFTQSFVAHIFGGNHRMSCSLIDVER